MNQAIIFDLDGTLIDTPKGIVETFTAVLKSMGAKIADAANIKATIGLPLEQAFGQLMGVHRDDDQVDHAVKKYQALFKDIVLPNAKNLVFPDVEKGLAMFKAQGFILSVATSKVYKSAEALLKAAGIFEYFNLVVGVDQVTLPKPHPEMGHLVMKNLGVLAEHTIMVGDTTHDILMAKNSGMRSIAVTYGVHDLQKLQSANPTWIADSFCEVLECVYSQD